MEPKIVGSSVLDTIPPDIVRFQWRGDLTATEIGGIREYTAAMREEIGDDRPIFGILELGDEARIGKKARKAIMGIAREQPWFKTVIIGARHEVKVLLELTVRAVYLLVKDATESRFMDTEAQAIAWFDEVRPATETLPQDKLEKQ